MALNTRSVLDPRFAYFARQSVVSTMWATIEISHPTNNSAWNPAKGDVYTGALDYSTTHYRGRARVQPNKDWRARRQRWEGESITEYAIRIQLDLTGNEVTNPDQLPETNASNDAGMLHVNDLVKVTGVYSPYGVPVDGLIGAYKYFVRNISASSNSWVRTILCDINADDVSI